MKKKSGLVYVRLDVSYHLLYNYNDNIHQSGNEYEDTIFRPGNKEEYGDFNTESIHLSGTSTGNSLMCYESRVGIKDDQNVDHYLALVKNLSVCTDKSEVKERTNEHKNEKTAFIIPEGHTCEMESNIEEVEEFHSIDVAKNESHKIEDSPTNDHTSMNDREMHKHIEHETTKRDRSKVKRGYRSDQNVCEEARSNTKEHGKSSCIFEAITGSLFKMKTSKKAFIFLLLILSGLHYAAPAAINHDQKTRGLEEYRLLITSKCNFRDIIRSESCHTNEESLNRYIDFCGFDGLCAIDSEPTCVDGEYGGMLHICSPKNITCAKGYRRKVWLDNDTDVVYVKEEKCPKGRYQPIESNCYQACSNRHEDLKDLPTQYSLFSKGDNKSPAWIYCNFEKGFYNMDGKFLLAYNDQFQYFPHFCTSVSEANPCGSEESPLPNGTCISPCGEGLKRDVHDNFKCTIKSGSESDGSTQKNNFSKKAYPQTTSAIAALTKSAVSDRNTSTTEKQSPSTETREDKEISITLQDVSSAVLIFLAVLVVLICMVLIGVYVLCCKRFKQRRRKTVNITRVRKTENKANFEYVDHVHIYQKTNGSKNDGTSDESIEMKGLL